MTADPDPDPPCEVQLAIRDLVLAAIGDGIAMVDVEGTQVFANPAAAQMLRSPDRNGVDLRNRLDDARDAAPGSRARERINVGGSVLEITSIPDPGAATGVVLLRDVTREINVERLSHDLVANASHEMKTPVASILALSASLSTAIGLDSDAAGRLVQRLESEAERLARMVDDLLRLSRLEGRPPQRVPTRLNGIVESQAEALRWRAELAGVTLRVSVPSQVMVTLAAEDDLALLVHNLVENAIRYSQAGGEVVVTLGRGADHATVTVADHGVGIPAGAIERIFERFYRVDTARSRETGGAGLGLSMVRSIAEAHGAVVEVESTLGMGSTFTVRLGLVT